jgi:hypothetical protein
MRNHRSSHFSVLAIVGGDVGYVRLTFLVFRLEAGGARNACGSLLTITATARQNVITNGDVITHVHFAS